MDGITKAYESAWQQLIMPAKHQYSDHDIGPDFLASSSGCLYSRKTLEISNSEG